MTPEQLKRFESALVAGHTLRQILEGLVRKERVPGLRVCTRGEFLRYCAEHPEFKADAYARAAVNAKAKDWQKGNPAKRAQTLCKKGHPLDMVTLNKSGRAYHRYCSTCIQLRSIPKLQRQRTETKRKQMNAFRCIEAAVPARLPHDVRGDVIQSLCEAMLKEKWPVESVKAKVKEHITKHYRQFTLYGPQSLDAPAFRDGATPLVETIAQGLWD